MLKIHSELHKFPVSVSLVESYQLRTDQQRSLQQSQDLFRAMLPEENYLILVWYL